MIRMPADPTPERLLVWAIRAGHLMTALAFLRTVGARDFAGAHPTLGGTPGQLGGDVGQIRRIEIGIHPTRLKAHARHVQLLVGELGRWMIAVHFVDGAIDLLAHGTRELRVARGGQALDALLVETGAQFRRAAALLSLAFMALC